MNMNNFIAVNENTEEILGKLVYYSVSNVLIDKVKFCEIGTQLGLTKVKPARESASDAFRNATGAIYERTVLKSIGQTRIIRVYCRDNKREDNDRIYRELVKETLGSSTNEYTKLANIYLDKKGEYVDYENVLYDSDVDTYKHCDRAVELFGLFQTCYGRSHVDTVIEALLEQMSATPISIHGKLYFVPKSHLHLVDILEDYIKEINDYNQNDTEMIANSIYLVDDEKQRDKMTREFYSDYKKNIEFYQGQIQRFLDNGCDSQKVIDRWMLKVETLQQKKALYEDVLKQELTDLDEEFGVLEMQAQELRYKAKNNANFQMTFAA